MHHNTLTLHDIKQARLYSALLYRRWPTQNPKARVRVRSVQNKLDVQQRSTFGLKSDG